MKTSIVYLLLCNATCTPLARGIDVTADTAHHAEVRALLSVSGDCATAGYDDTDQLWVACDHAYKVARTVTIHR